MRLVCVSVFIAALAFGCDEQPAVDSSLVSHARPSVAANGVRPETPTDPDPVAPVDPNPDPVDPDPVEPDPVDPDPVDPDPVDPDPVDPDPTPDGVIRVTNFPFVHRADTTTGQRILDRYSCAPGTREGGPENVYQVTLPKEGLLVASLDDLTTGVDVDVHILGSADPATCLDRGNWSAAAFLPAGTYYVVADTWVNASGTEFPGAYTLTLGLTTADAFADQGLSEDILAMALVAFANAWAMGDTERLEYTVIDFTYHSAKTRLWTIDLHDGSLIFDERVTHGEGSDDPSNPGFAKSFSNIEGSHQSSLGMMRTATRYMSGDNGLSLRLKGLEPGINDAVYDRAIVIHSDSYASANYVAQHGRMGTSWGCQVIDPVMIEDYVDTLEDGALVWSWFPDPNFADNSIYLEGAR